MTTVVAHRLPNLLSGVARAAPVGVRDDPEDHFAAGVSGSSTRRHSISWRMLSIVC